MVLKKLIVHGFKSFADKVELTFDHGITGVVGPNGCGKSNISDAVRWVLGEQSAKSLRGAKMEDVIFNGTEKRRKQAYCEVTLVFDNADHTLAIDFAEVSISRRVYRNGDSDYQINGASCRLRDIVDLFRDTGLGRDGYSIIGQGRVDEILSQKTEDRRQVFEEAAGIMKYKSRKQEAERKLENSTVNLERVEDILSELEQRVEPLRQQSEEAREYLSLRDELKILELNVFLNRSVKYEARINELQTALREAERDNAAAAEELENLTAERDANQMELDRLEMDSAEKREEVQALIRDVESGEGDVGVMRERIAADTRERDRLTLQLEAAQGDGSGIGDQIESMTANLASEQAKLASEEASLNAREAELAGQEKRLSEAENASEEAKSEIIRAMNRLSDVRSQQARLSAMKAALEQQLASLDVDSLKDEEGMHSLNELVNNATSQLDDESARLTTLKKRIEEVVETVRVSGDTSQRLAKEITAVRDRRQQCESRLRLLKEMQKDYEGLNNSVKQVLYQARRTQNSGVHGVVADIIKAPEKLERALDMVLGAALQNIVVDRDEDAKRMIEYLRANRFGRATFLPISSVRGRTLAPGERGVLNMPGCIGLASELIEFDPKYQGVIDNLLGRTVVAQDLNAGIAIQRAGRYQFRLVTLDGDVMHSGGSMTGGSVQSRMTSLLSRAREIEETEKLLKQLVSDMEQRTAEMEKQEARRSELKQERAELFDALHAQEIICARAEEALKAAQDERAGYLERSGKLHSEKERLATQLSETNEALERLEGSRDDAKQNTDEMQARVRAMQNEIFELRGIVEQLRADVSDSRVKYATHLRDCDAMARDLERLKKQAGDTEQLLRDTAEQLEVCSNRLSENAANLETCITALEYARRMLDKARSEYDVCEQARTGAQKKVKEFSARIEKLRMDVEAQSDQRHRTEMSLQRTETEYKQIQDHIWTEYELTYAGAETFRTQDFKLTEAEKRFAQIRARIRQMGMVNVAAVDEYRQTVQRVEELTSQRDDLNVAIADLTKIVSELEKNMERQFRKQFEVMNENFKRTFTKLFGGGSAELRLADPSDALNCGIDIVAQPPGKKLQNLSLLSGGERALTAIAILFAMLDLKPTPFCILDEIEAALDDANIDNFADYLKTYSAKTQFVVITHRKGTMERCESLYGVVMEEKGVSKLVSVSLNEAV